MKRSVLELQLEGQMEYIGLPKPLSEYRFHSRRMWRFDFAWPERMVAVEVEGGIYNGGRHVTPEGYTNDCIKYNEAACLGWKVIRATPSMIQDGTAVNFIAKAMGYDDEMEDRESNLKKTRRRKIK